MSATRKTGDAPQTPAERMARSRWSQQLAATLAKAARLVSERPEGKALPQMPGPLFAAYWSEGAAQRIAAGRPPVPNSMKELRTIAAQLDRLS